MRHTARVCLAGAVLGAAAGAAVAFLYATPEGARRRAEIGRAVDRLTIDAEEGHRLWLRLRDAWGQLGHDLGRPRRAMTRPSAWPPEDVA